MNDEFHDFEDLLRDEHFPTNDNFTARDIKWALYQLMDGVKEHDLPGMTGLSIPVCDLIFRIAQFAAKKYGNFVVGENVRFAGCADIGQIEEVYKDSVDIRCDRKSYRRKFDEVYTCND